MDICYNKLWSILENKNMSKARLAKEAGLDIKTVNKLERNENIRVEVLVKICRVLDCAADEIFEINTDRKIID